MSFVSVMIETSAWVKKKNVPCAICECHDRDRIMDENVSCVMDDPVMIKKGTP